MTELKRFCFFVLPTAKDAQGNYQVLRIIDGETGYYITNWTCGKDLKIAEKYAEEQNKKLGLSEEEVETMIIQSMRSK